MPTRLFDRAGFWVQVGGVVTGLGAIGIVVGTVNLAPRQGNREPWFAIGIALAILGAIALLWSITLYVRHGYAEGHAPSTPPVDPSYEAEVAAANRAYNDVILDLTDLLRDRSAKASDADSVAQREALRAAGKDFDRLVHGSTKYQVETMSLFRTEGLRKRLNAVLRTGMELGLISNELATETGASHTPQELWANLTRVSDEAPLLANPQRHAGGSA